MMPRSFGFLVCWIVGPIIVGIGCQNGQAKTRAQEDRTVAAIKHLGGDVGVDEDAPERPIILVSFPVSTTRDPDLKLLETLTKVRQLHLAYNKNVSDKGLRYLKGLPDLQIVT